MVDIAYIKRLKISSWTFAMRVRTQSLLYLQRRLCLQSHSPNVLTSSPLFHISSSKRPTLLFPEEPFMTFYGFVQLLLVLEWFRMIQHGQKHCSQLLLHQDQAQRLNNYLHSHRNRMSRDEFKKLWLSPFAFAINSTYLVFSYIYNSKLILLAKWSATYFYSDRNKERLDEKS